jgi:uncharacterized protein YgbK (DUF1537 family)
MRQHLIIADDLSGTADCTNACMSAGLKAVVTFDETENHLASDLLSANCNARRLLTDSLGGMLKPRLHVAGAWVASGESACAVLAGWRVTIPRLIGQVEPGPPFSLAHCEGAPLPVLTRAGSFGKPETLLRCLDFLDNRKRSAGVIRQQASHL